MMQVEPSTHHPVSTIDPVDASRVEWDAVVVGAGLAGSVAARGLADAGHRVLLVERTTFPRSKVCGCCLGRLGQATLDAVGLGHVLESCGARPLEDVRLHVGRRPALVPLRDVVGVSREALDQRLAAEAVAAGADLLLDTRADASEDGSVRVHVGGARHELTARTVILAAGLRSHATDRASSRRSQLVGFGAMASSSSSPVGSGTVEMVIDRAGYVGVAPLEDGRVTIASALRSDSIRGSGGARAVLQRLLQSAGLGELTEGDSVRFTGVPTLRRQRAALQAGRLLAVGDAAGFVEPITGEGMSWALAGGAAVVPCAQAAIRDGMQAADWQSTWRRLMRRRHLRCSIVGASIRHPSLVRTALAASSLLPPLRGPFLAGLIGGADPVPEGSAA